MAKLQACPKCGAQFDVTAFARGQQFRCGACGHLLVAHADASAPPAAAAPTGRAPGTRPSTPAPATAPTGRAPGTRPAAPAPASAARGAPGATASQSSAASSRSPRGPQYQPVQRAEAPPAAPARSRASGREDDDAEGGRHGRARGGARGGSRDGGRKGPPVALFAGLGGLVVVGVVLAVALRGGGKDQPSGGGGGTAPAPVAQAPKPEEPPAESLAVVKAAWRKVQDDVPPKDAAFRGIMDRLKRVGTPEAHEVLKEVYEVYVETPFGMENVEARKALGFTKFDFEVPEAITQTKGYDFVTAVEEARKRRWLDDEALALANQARKQCEEHAKRLLEDRVYRAGDNIWANILKEPLLKDYNFSTRWVAPHMICYSSKDRLSELELLQIKDKKERREKIEEMKKKRAHFQPLLDEKAEIYSQLYKEWNRRFQQALGLKDLADEYGGRADYPQGVKSFADGAPLVVWIFDTHDAFKDYNKKKGWDIPDGVRGYFQWSDAWIYLFDEGNKGEERIFEIGKNLHEGTHQLEHWFNRQVNRWKNPNHTQSWFGEGMAEYFGAHKMTPEGKIEFIGVNASRLKGAQDIAAMLKKQGRKYHVAEMSEMVKWTSYAEAAPYAQKNGLEPGMGQEVYIYEQGWMFFYMCMDGLEGKYRDKILAYVKAVLGREEGPEAFRRCFKIRDEEDWDALQKDFEAFVQKMLALDVKPYMYAPPKRGELDGK